MFTPLLAAVLAVQVPPPPPTPQAVGPLDAPAYTDTAFGVVLPRPGDSWVFEPARSRGTTTVIFHPRGVSLSDQLWGALVMTRFPRAVRLAEVAAERVSGSWRPTFGASFQLLTRDSLTLAGHPAIHVVMSGTVNRTAFDVEEYLVARGTDLILLQFRYPRALPRDSIAQGYDRALRGLLIHAGPIPATAAAPPPSAPAPAAPLAVPSEPSPLRLSPPDYLPPPRQTLWSVLGWSPWRARRVDVAVALETPTDRLAFAARLELVNDGLVPLDSVPLWLPAGFTVDSVRALNGPLSLRYRDDGLLLRLPDTVGFQAAAVVSLYLRAAPLTQRASFVEDWLPAIQSRFDSLGAPRATAEPPITIRFDLPQGLAAVATGHLTADLVAAGRHRQIWSAVGVPSRAPGFVIGPFAPVARASGRLAITIWSPVYSDAPLDSAARLVAEAWGWHARAFGVVMEPEFNLVVGAPLDRGLPGLAMLTEAAADQALTVYREVARTWWGGAVRLAGAGGAWLEHALPWWCAVAIGNAGVGAHDMEQVWRRLGANAPLAALAPASPTELELLVSKGVVALEAARSALGEARFREVMRTLAVDYRGRFVSANELLALMDEPSRARLREFLY